MSRNALFAIVLVVYISSIQGFMAANRMIRHNKLLMKNDNEITIEYCTGCKWMLRATYYAQEILSTFESHNLIDSIKLKPNYLRNGTFQIYCRQNDNDIKIWDRKDESTKGFPDVKTIKQLIRDIYAPDVGLGHSDKPKVIDINEQ